VHNEVESLLPQESKDGLSVSDVEFNMSISAHGRLEAPLVPARIAVGTKEYRPHVVVDAHNVRAYLAEVRDRLGADKTVRTCDEHPHGVRSYPDRVETARRSKAVRSTRTGFIENGSTLEFERGISGAQVLTS
jgi:hypothetical protein